MKKVLIIEDNPDNMKLTVTVLQTAGYKPIQARNALRGIELAKSELPDLILMDIQLPEMGGLEAVKILREDPSTSGITIIALTAYAMNGDREHMLSSGCDGYVAKPIRYKEFLKLIKDAIG